MAKPLPRKKNYGHRVRETVEPADQAPRRGRLRHCCHSVLPSSLPPPKSMSKPLPEKGTTATAFTVAVEPVAKHQGEADCGIAAILYCPVAYHRQNPCQIRRNPSSEQTTAGSAVNRTARHQTTHSSSRPLLAVIHGPRRSLPRVFRARRKITQRSRQKADSDGHPSPAAPPPRKRPRPMTNPPRKRNYGHRVRVAVKPADQASKGKDDCGIAAILYCPVVYHSQNPCAWRDPLRVGFTPRPRHRRLARPPSPWRTRSPKKGTTATGLGWP